MKKFLPKITGLLLLASFAVNEAVAQSNEPDPMWIIGPSVAFQSPGGDLGDRFGNNFALGLGAAYKFKSNWEVGIDGQFMFGSDVLNSEAILDGLLTANGNIINSSGGYADLRVFERGVYGDVNVSRIFNSLGVNENSGLKLTLGAGYMVNWIEFDNIGNDSPQILGEYTKGYDRLSGGIMLRESIGYLFLSSKRRINFQLSFELIQAFTTNLRGINYDTGLEDSDVKADLLYGIRLNWYIPIYQKSSDNTYFFD